MKILTANSQKAIVRKREKRRELSGLDFQGFQPKDRNHSEEKRETKENHSGGKTYSKQIDKAN